MAFDNSVFLHVDVIGVSEKLLDHDLTISLFAVQQGNSDC